jgi:hypothetical protein
VAAAYLIPRFSLRQRGNSGWARISTQPVMAIGPTRKRQFSMASTTKSLRLTDAEGTLRRVSAPLRAHRCVPWRHRGVRPANRVRRWRGPTRAA